MATRRVKRIKRSKKHVHRARGRKTNHRRRRHTRRQTGGEIITVCKKTGNDFLRTAKGITITYDTVDNTYTIGNHPYATLKTIPRYTAALDIVRDHVLQVFNDAAPVVLTQAQFDIFKGEYCPAFAPIGGQQQCESIKGFLRPVDSAAAPAPVAPAAAAAPAVPKMSRNELMVIEGNIAYNNSKGEMKVVKADRSKTEYEFDNFIIPIEAGQPDHNISGKLTVKFVPGPQLVTKFILELSMSSITPELIECVKGINDLVVNIENVSNSFSAMVITGTLTEQRVGEKKSTYDFSSFVLNFVENYQDCLVAGQFVVSDPKVYINLITEHIAECSQRIDNDTVFSLKQKMSLKAVLTVFQQKLKQTKDLEALKTLHEEVNQFRNMELLQAKKTSLAAQMGYLSVRGPGAGAAAARP